MFIEDTNNITSLDTKANIRIDILKCYHYTDREVEYTKDMGKKIFTETNEYDTEMKYSKYLTVSLDGLETTIDNKNYKWSRDDNLFARDDSDFVIEKYISLDFENKTNLKKEIQKSFIEEFENAVKNQTEQLNLKDFFNEVVAKKMTEFS